MRNAAKSQQTTNFPLIGKNQPGHIYQNTAAQLHSTIIVQCYNAI